MKTGMAILMIALLATSACNAQNVNWASLRADRPNSISVSPGFDYGATLQFGYARSFDAILPVVLGVDYSFPMGRDLFDDFKVRLGCQVEVVAFGGVAATVRIASVFRRYENTLVRIASFGSDFALVLGFYRPAWYVAGEGGFDKAITSHLKHSDAMKDIFPGVRDGWYVPTGGNFYYGVTGGVTLLGTLDLSARIGATTAQPRDEGALVPLYVQVGFGIRL